MSQHHRKQKHTTHAGKARPIIAASLPAPCIEGCGRLVVPGEAWQVGHIRAAALGGQANLSNYGPVHRSCNARSGGRLGAAMTNRGQRARKRLPNW